MNMDGSLNFSKTLDNESAIDHNLLLNYEANEHIDWTNATQTLTTTGNINVGGTTISGTLRYTAGTPIDGYLLQSDGSGNASWVPPFVLEDEHETAFSGLGFTSPAVSVKVQKVGNTVSLGIPTFAEEAKSSGTFINSTVALPLAYRPVDPLVATTVVTNDGVIETAFWVLASDGILSLNAFSTFNIGIVGLLADSNLTYTILAA